VLLRAGEVTEGLDAVIRRRGRADHLTDGPGKLGQALGISGDQDGTDLQQGPVRLEPGPGLGTRHVEQTPRVGISKAMERRWRFVVVG
jgi:DNA-3-methyladenine glycosylase